MNYAKHVSMKNATQTEMARKDQVKNNAGGYVFQIKDMSLLERFVILGTEGNTYYCSEKNATLKASNTIIELIKNRGAEVVKKLVEIRTENRAYKQSPLIFVLALVFNHGNTEAKNCAKENFNKLIWTFTQLAEFCQFIKELRSFGRSVRGVIANWYNSKSSKALAMQLIKYPSRGGWKHIDVFRLSHSKLKNELDQLLKMQCGKDFTATDDEGIRFMLAAEKLKKLSSGDVNNALKLQKEYKFPFEAYPTELLRSPEIWEALIPDMGLIAMIRNLGRMTANGTLKPLTKLTKFICQKISSEEELKSAKVHPLQIIAALITYKQGHGSKGDLQWNPIQSIVESLEEGLEKSFNCVEPTGKNFMLACDISRSMSDGTICGIDGLTPAIGTAVIALQFAKIEKWCAIYGFSNSFIDLGITKKDSFASTIRKMKGLPFDGTDCSLPMKYATEKGLDIDCFVVITDNETWCGNNHPFRELQNYRKKMNKPDARMIVVGMTATSFSIADPNDPGSMDIVGFDTNGPKLIQEFGSGKL